MIFKTYRLDLVEFSLLVLPHGSGTGTQMLWRNPPGFNANSGEYVKVQIPWLLSKGGSEWHPFSICLHEVTEEGLDEVLRKKYEVSKTRVHLGGLGGRPVDPLKTAVLLVEIQNEFASKGGKLHDSVKDVMKSSTDMLRNTLKLADYARSVGAHVFHVPIVFREDGSDNPNKNLGILKACHNDNCFVNGTWNSEIIDSHKPKLADTIIQGKIGLDSFIGTDLQEQLEKKGIETVMLRGFLTNCCVDSTMRTAYEKGYNVITLTDGTACTSEAEQAAAIQYSYKWFSAPMSCAEACQVLGNVPEKLISELPGTSLNEDVDEEEEPASLIRTDLQYFIRHSLNAGVGSINKDRTSLIMQEARQELRSRYNTTQIFVIPAGDWTKQVYEEVSSQKQLRSCWVRGPYVSPYSIAGDFNHLVLLATGIGVTPALGIMGQFKGASRTKVLVWVWATRCPRMLKFFVPLLEDARMAIIYYSGKEVLSAVELRRLTSRGGNILIHQASCKSLQETVSTVITTTTSVLDSNGRTIESVRQMPSNSRKQWCILYCGGSKGIRDAFVEYSQEVGVKFEYELFDW